MARNPNIPSDKKILLVVLACGVMMVSLFVALNWLLSGNAQTSRFAQRHHWAEVVALTDVSSGTGVSFDVRVRIDHGRHEYVSDRYRDWTFLNVDTGKIDLTQPKLCVLQWHRADLPKLVERHHCVARVAQK